MDSIRTSQPGRPRPLLGPQTDEVALKYTALADEAAGLSSEGREAAMLLVVAEGHLIDRGDHEKANAEASKALDLFRALGDAPSEADAMRLVTHTLRMQADLVGYEGGPGAENRAADLYDEAEKRVKQQLKRFKDAGDRRNEACMLLSLAELADDRRTKYEPEELREILRLASEAKALFQEVGDKKMEALALMLISATQYRRFEKHDAYMATEAALLGFRASGDRRNEAKALYLLANAHILRNELEEGIQVSQDALTIFREQGMPMWEAFVNFCIAEYYLRFRKGRDALPYAEDALEHYRVLGFCKGWPSLALDAMSQAFALRGEDRKAISLAKEAVETFREEDDKRQLAVAQNALVKAYLAQGDLDEALRAVEEEQQMVQELGDVRWEAGVLLDVAQVHLQRGALDLAADAANEATEIFQGTKDRQGEAFGMNKLNEVNLARFDDDAVMQTTIEQRAIFQELEDKSRAASCQLTIAGLTVTLQDQYDEATAMVEEAMEWFQEMRDKEGEGRALNFLAQFHADTKDYANAVEKAKEMRECLREYGFKALEANACRVLCDFHLQFEEPREAVRAAREGLALVKKAMDKREIVDYLLLVSNATMALITKDTGDSAGKGIEKALRPAKEAFTIAKTLTRGTNSLMGQALYTVSSVQLFSGRVNEAMVAARQAVDIFRSFGDKQSEAAAVLQIAEIHLASGAQDKALDAANEALAQAKDCQDPSTVERASELVEKIQGKPRLSYEHVGGYAAGAGEGPAATSSAPGAAASAEGGAAASEVVAQPKGLDPEEVERVVQEMAKAAIGLDDAVYLDSPLMDSGMDSLTAVSFRNGLQQNLGVKLPSSLMFDYPTMKEVAGRIVELSLEE